MARVAREDAAAAYQSELEARAAQTKELAK